MPAPEPERGVPIVVEPAGRREGVGVVTRLATASILPSIELGAVR